MVPDTQRRAVFEAIAGARALTTFDLVELDVVPDLCRALAVSPPTISITADGARIGRDRVEMPEGAGVLMVAHAMAHVATDEVFPPHGAEFCARMLTAVGAIDPLAAEILRAEFDARRVHHTSDHRRRAVAKAVAQRSLDGTQLVEAVLDDPPETIVGGPVRRDPRGVLIGSRLVSLDRLRYLAKVA